MEEGVRLCLNHSELCCPVSASVSPLGPWEGPGEIQSLTMPKMSQDCSLTIS